MPKEPTMVLYVRIPTVLKEQVDMIAEASGLSQAKVAGMLIRKALETYAQEHDRTE